MQSYLELFGEGYLSPITRQPLLKMIAMTAAADPNDTAVALAEPPAGFVSFRRQQPSFPPTQNVNSAACSLTSACHFGGKCANCAENAVTTAI